VRLAGLHAVVTGGGSGIGAAIARALAAEGAKLSLIGRRRERLEDVASALRSPRAKPKGAGLPPRSPRAKSRGADANREQRPSTSLGTNEVGAHVACIPADVTDRAAVDSAFAAARNAHGPIAILVNNAGGADSAPFAKLAPEAWRAAMAVNLDALFHCCQAALDDLLAAENGRIVTIASTASLKGYAYTAHYVAAKHGALGLTRALAAEFARTRLTVNAVCPGFVDTEMTARAIANIRAKTGRDAADIAAELAAFNPQQRLVTPEEVAAAALFLCLPESRSINGQAIGVNGGEVT
jgi:NAD(P)-dependent dehydrogenase (short-subunit alcohol dehydrogenase family)